MKETEPYSALIEEMKETFNAGREKARKEIEKEMLDLDCKTNRLLAELKNDPALSFHKQNQLWLELSSLFFKQTEGSFSLYDLENLKATAGVLPEKEVFSAMIELALKH